MRGGRRRAGDRRRAGPIAKPVGQGPLARNLPDEVRTIQEALNQVTVRGVVGGPMPLLAVDGIKGPKTQAAILAFQRAQVGDIVADGVIEPGRKTILRLNAIVAPVSKIDLNPRLALAARAEVLAADHERATPVGVELARPRRPKAAYGSA